MKYSLGIDIGSASAKLALLNDLGGIVILDIEKITASPQDAASSLLSRLSARVRLEDITTAGVSGSGKSVIPKDLNWSVYSSSLSIAAGILRFHPDAKTILQIGGQTSLVIGLEDGLKKPWKVASNPLCAAGTGRFLDQQSYRLGIKIEDFADTAQKTGETAPRIAARCSVFAKTDLIHLQQKGIPLGAMLRGLCDSIARGVVSLTKGVFAEPVYFVGGVAANKAIVESLEEAVSARNGHKVTVNVPDNFFHIEAIGSALLALEAKKQSRVIFLPKSDVEQCYWETPRLGHLTQETTFKHHNIDKPFNGYLGVDIGSTSTKAVILDESGKQVLAKNYLMTAGRPIDAIQNVFKNLLAEVGDNAKILGVGITGSGRYLVGSYIGADLIRNEITAQTRAAADVDPDADIIEIGGQDSKLVLKRNGVVVDYQMNKACAAGTGSFIDELAEQLGVNVKNGEFAKLAFQAPHTIGLGSRCAAFMGQAVASAKQEGVPVEIICASLANSIAGNYLSKVVSRRKLGDKVILTGAVFYNDAVVSAFKQALPGKTIIVPEHKEVSGAMGAALLAREWLKSVPSRFKGFQQVIDQEYKLSTFICKGCENNCTISRLDIAGEHATFYGSRCDKYDSSVLKDKQEPTPFDEREKLLFKEYKEGTGTGPTVGIPRALATYDFAPLLIGFLNDLDVKVILSSKTNKHIIEQACELSYTDSCFPIKLLHGHAASLEDVDYILYPSAIRLGLKDGDENQKYSCPLVQASPYIIGEALDLGEKLLIPTLDFSMGDEDVVKNLTDAAAKMGFSRAKGKKAALAGIRAFREFERAQIEAGRKILDEIHKNKQTGVVIMARSYMSQDAGANLGIAKELADLGVVPIPMEFLDLKSVNPKDYSDRPYWFYEGKHISAASIVAKDPQLYGLLLTNFGCGPNSFIIKMAQDIMGGKPMGQLEIDEHAAEAGLITRLEAFVDTINSYSKSGKAAHGFGKEIYRSAPTMQNKGQTIMLPRMAPQAEMLAAAMRAFGVKAFVLPETTEHSLQLSNKVTEGTECLPYRVTLGDFIYFMQESDHKGIDMNNVEGFMPSAFGPCRFGKYVVEEVRALKDLGFDLPFRTTVSNNAYRDLGLGTAFERLAWRGIVAMDYLERILWRTRPYEKNPGAADALFNKYTARIVERIEHNEAFNDLLQAATAEAKSIMDKDMPRKPLVGINGEIFLRSNRFSNCDLARQCEKAGLEVIVSPMGEWMNYITHRNIEDGVREKQLKKMTKGYIKKLIQEKDERSVAVNFNGLLDIKDPTTKEVLALSGTYLSAKCGSEAVLSLGTGIEWLENDKFAGVISVMPHGCMPGGIVAAMSEKLSEMHHKPWINLTYDGTMETNNLERINNFAEIIRFCSGQHI
ncbi:MAG: acyl-CoA dehydratase activase [Dehalococcoidia bacterium]|jgi:activator of 2-hydroxyglutaryl-CoA dehydratase/predicted nucleotide-binding protein (sugar kinase/HSP70/actin superfamily)